MAGGMYILEGKMPRLTMSAVEWSRWFQSADRSIRRDEVNGYTVSTVFLGLDHNYSQHVNSGPILFETMVFGEGEWSEECQRWYTYDNAVDGHEAIVNRIAQGLLP